MLFRNCCKRNCISKDNGQFQKAKLRLRRLFSLQPKVQHYSTPASLRVTSSQSSYDPREPAQRAGLLRGDQVGVQPSVYAWYRFADVKNGKSFLELLRARTVESLCTHTAGVQAFPLLGKRNLPSVDYFRGTTSRRKTRRLFAQISLVVVDEVPLTKNDKSFLEPRWEV